MTLSSRKARSIRALRIAEQGGRCCYCKRTFAESGPLQPTLEHRRAKMDGGGNEVTNLAVACLHCNQHRGRQKQQARQRAQARAAAQASSPSTLASRT